MGSFYHSLSIPRSVRGDVERLVSSWLSARGFERADESVLDLDQEGERGCLLVWDGRWTTVLYSHFDEEDRLRLELEKLGLPLLRLWLHDSDLWGYELHEEGEVVSAFNSNPRYFGEEAPAEAPNDAARVARVCLGDESLAGELLSLQKKKGVFMDPACDRFARRLGVPPAATQYQYALAGEKAWEDFSEAHLRFRRPGFDPMAGFDLHRLRIESPPLDAAVPAWKPSPAFRLLTGALRVLFYPLSLYSRWKMRSGTKAPEAGPSSGEEWKAEGGFLVNERRRCRISLAHGAEAARGPGILPFRIGSLPVSSHVRSGRMVAAALQSWRGREIESDEKSEVGDFPARFIVSIWPQPRRFMYEILIATPIAVYWFQTAAEEPLGDDALARLRATIGSFELLP